MVVEEGMVVVVVMVDTFCGCRSSLFSDGVAVVLRWSQVNQTIIRRHGTSPHMGSEKTEGIAGLKSRELPQEA